MPTDDRISVEEQIADLQQAVEFIDCILSMNPIPAHVDTVLLSTKRDMHLARIAELESPESDLEQDLRFN